MTADGILCGQQLRSSLFGLIFCGRNYGLIGVDRFRGSVEELAASVEQRRGSLVSDVDRQRNVIVQICVQGVDSEIGDRVEIS